MIKQWCAQQFSLMHVGVGIVNFIGESKKLHSNIQTYDYSNLILFYYLIG